MLFFFLIKLFTLTQAFSSKLARSHLPFQSHLKLQYYIRLKSIYHSRVYRGEGEEKGSHMLCSCFITKSQGVQTNTIFWASKIIFFFYYYYLNQSNNLSVLFGFFFSLILSAPTDELTSLAPGRKSKAPLPSSRAARQPHGADVPI